MEQEQKAENIGDRLEKKNNSFDLNKFVEDLLLHLKQLEEKLLEYENVKEYRDSESINKAWVDFQLKVEALKEYCNNFSLFVGDVCKSADWEELTNLSEKLELLSQRISKFIELFSGRKQVTGEFLKKLDFIIMNEAIKNEMVSHIFDMLNRGESKEKLMIASLEFVYFLKEIESDGSLNELKELKNILITTQKEESNIYHFLEKLKEKIAEFSRAIENSSKKVEDLRKTAEELKTKVEQIVSEINKGKELFLDKVRGK